MDVIRSYRCIMDVTATLDYEVTNYLEQINDMGVGKFVSSRVFTVAGYDWEIRFYPAGQKKSNCAAGRASCFLRYLSQAKDVRAKFTIRMIETNTQSELDSFEVQQRTFSPGAVISWGRSLVARSKLEAMSRHGDGCFTVRCVLTVSNDSPPLELPRDLGRMLWDGRGADVRFRVGGRKFRAHRCVLAARSPVFGAQLFGPMAVAEKNMRRVKVVDMEPSIFEMMLRYIYTDALPPCEDEGGAYTYSAPVMQHLLVAADRYGLERLKQMCEEELSKRIDVEGVVLTFALANQHHCNLLQNACTEFMSSKEMLVPVLESDEFKKRFITSCRPLPLELEGGALGTNSSSPEEEFEQSKKSKRMRTK